MNSDNKNFILAIALSVVIIIGWQLFYAQPEIERQRQLQEKHATQTSPDGESAVPQAGGDKTVPRAAENRAVRARRGVLPRPRLRSAR